MGKQPIKKKNNSSRVSQEDIDKIKADELFVPLQIDLSDELLLEEIKSRDELEVECEVLRPKEIIAYTPPEVTKETLKQQHEEAMQKLNDFYALQAGKEGEIKYYNLETSKTAMGSYNEDTNVLAVGNLGKFEDEPMKFERVLQHEQHHRNFAHTKITTQDGKEVLARQAPMSMTQHYRLEQADEVGSKITELMTMRQKYVETYGVAEKSKQLARTYLANYTDENAVKLREALEKGYTVTAMEGNKFKIKNGEKEEIADMGDRNCSSVKTYIRKEKAFKNLDNEMRNEWVNDKDTGWYWREVKMGYAKPLSTEPYDMKRDMDRIGSGMAQSWMSQHSAEYVEQCTGRTKAYFDEHNFQEIKPNNDNYNKAMSAALTVGGWDFSESVKGRLSAPEKFQKIDEQIAKGENEASVIKSAEKQGVRLGKNRNTFSENIEYRIAAELAGKDKVTGVEEKITERPFIWDEKQESHFKTAMENLEKMNLPEKDKQEIQKLRQELGWDNKKKGETVTPEEMEKLDALSTKISKSYNPIWRAEIENGKVLADWEKYNQYSDNLCAIKNDYNIKNVSEQERAQYEKIYNKVKKESDRPFNEINIISVQQYISEIKSGVEQGKSAEEFRLPTGYRKEYRNAVLLTSKHNKDFSQPFLADYYKALQDHAAKEAKDRVDTVVRNKQQLAKKEQEQEKQQQTAQTNTNTQTQVVAYANQSSGR